MADNQWYFGENYKQPSNLDLFMKKTRLDFKFAVTAFKKASSVNGNKR